MDNNDILRRLRYAFNISDSAMIGIFKRAGYDISESAVLDRLKKEGDAGYAACGDRELGLFLDGLIIQNRGKKETTGAEPVVKSDIPLSNNLVLKKLRIALNLKENDMFEMFKLSKFEITKPELSAFFRKQGHKNYKVCGDQILRNFLQGLTVHFRT
jgi:uncharacterized protein YehS (DUF1456 family)